MKYLFLLLVLLPIPAIAGSPSSCVEMMRLHYLWLEKNKIERAEKQLKVATKVCLPVVINEQKRTQLLQLIQADKNLINMYERLIDKGIVKSSY